MRPVSAATLLWYLLRITGLAVVALAFAHLWVMHYAHAPSTTGLAFVAARWSHAFWRWFDWALLMLALLHGFGGLYGIVRESSPGAAARLLGALVLAATAAFAVLGTVAIVAGAANARTGGALWIATALSSSLVVAATLAYAAVAAVLISLAVRLAAGSPIGRWTLAGQWAWGLHRVTGLGILAFLAIHVIDVALAPFAPAAYSATVAAYGMPYLVPMELALVGAVVYHGLNGLRLMLLEALPQQAARLDGALLTLAIVMTAAALVPAAWVIMLG